MPGEVLEYVVSLRGGSEAAAQARHVASGVEEVAAATERVKTTSAEAEGATNRFAAELDRIGRFARAAKGELIGLGAAAREHLGSASMGRESKSLEHGVVRSVGGRGASFMGGTLLGGLLGFASVQGIKDSIQSTAELSKSVQFLTQMTGMDTKAAAEWTAVAESRGISTQSLNVGFKTLATQMEHALAGTKTSVETFKALGISQAMVQAHSHDLSGMMGLVADRLNAMHGGAIKTAAGAALLGRNFALLNPILSEGSKGMAELRNQAAAYGVTLGGNAAKNVVKMREATENLKLAQIGLSVQFTEHVAPALIKVTLFMIKLAEAVVHNLAPAFKAVVGVVKDVVGWFERHKIVAVVLAGAIGGLVIALTALKVAELATAAATAILNFIVEANPFVRLAIVIGAAVAALIYLYTTSKTFRDVVSAVFGVVKTIVMTVVGVVVFFGKTVAQVFGPIVTGAIHILVSIVKNGFQIVKGIIMVIVGLLTLNFSEAWDGVKKIFSAGLTMIGDVLGSIVTVIVKVGGTILSVLLAPFKLAWSGIQTVIGYIVTGITQLPSTLASAGEHMWDWMLNALKNVVNAIITVINTVVIGGINAMINGINSVTGSIPLVGGSLHIGTLAPISPLGGGGGSSAAPTTPITPLPPSTTRSHGLTGGSTHTIGTGFAKGDLVIKVDGRELARIQKRELWKAMAAGA